MRRTARRRGDVGISSLHDGNVSLQQEARDDEAPPTSASGHRMVSPGTTLLVKP